MKINTHNTGTPQEMYDEDFNFNNNNPIYTVLYIIVIALIGYLLW
ncbi:hypothetical protein UFOVP1615_44 [uncultured Caudovirales phage]|uniref:Uncharacterized protein n=1 Tax=uncultured Caudovirales phage TaxID=2100421 RepID=A0A6J5SVH0_9CAUD|nr:hypothetical protein UFOVP1615_44 [uncultured Caudovirales phage]